MSKIAIIQRPPVLLDRSATIAGAVQSVAEAAAAGASLIVLPESYIPDYIPQDVPALAQLFPDPDEWINDGDSVVVDPQGRIVAGPLHREAAILYADIDVALVAPARRTLDVAGHYGRPDIFELQVRRTPTTAVRYVDA
jgi:predicted amidohydrolase